MEAGMKYMLLIYADEKVWTEPERQECYGESTQLAHQLAKDGATVVEIPQTARNMGAAFDELLSALKAGRFHHDGDPVLAWMAGNVVAKTVTKGVTVPSKEKPEQKIDGIVAICMALSRAIAEEAVEQPQYQVFIL